MSLKGAVAAIARRKGKCRDSRVGSPLWRRLGFALLLLGLSGTAQAGIFCSDAPFNGIMDGDALYTDPADSQVLTGSAYFAKYNITQVTIDTDCTFRDWPVTDALNVTVNFQTNDPSIYLIVFDNVWFDGNMACSNIDHKLWVVNSDPNAFKGACQDLFIPAETIDKDSPAEVSGNIGDATVGIGEQFTYRLTVPSMVFPAGDPSPNQLRNIYISDDLNATANGVDAATPGADLTLVGYTVTPVGASPAVTLEEIDVVSGAVVLPSGDTVLNEFCNGQVHGSKNICLKFPGNIEIGDQYIIDITVSVDNTAQNQTSPTFINEARWWFGRDIDIDGDGNITPEEQFTPLPGENGRAGAMAIGAPDLVVDKFAADTAMNISTPNQFTIDVRNAGTTDAWNVTVFDQLPDFTSPPEPDPAGICPAAAPSLAVQLYTSGGAISGTPIGAPLVAATDYTYTYDSANCQITVTTLTAAAVIEPDQHLVITYSAELDGDTTADGFDLTNYAAATEWFSAQDTGTPADRIQYTEALTDGTTSTVDHEDAFTVTTGLTGFYFQKTARNLTTGEFPATNAVPGDVIRYELRVFNVNQTVADVTITDTVDSTKFDIATLTPGPAPAGAAFYNVGNVVTFTGSPSQYDVSALAEVNVYFDVTVAATVANGDLVSNTATLDSTVFTNIDSDDPFVTGNIGNAADPGYNPDSTDFYIRTPGDLSKSNTATTARVGDQITYTLQIPSTTVDAPLYDVKIFDDLAATGADLSLVSATVTAGGSWTLTNIGTATSLELANLATGIDIPANGQITVELTVEVLNTTTNQAGVIFNNSAYYTYNRSNGIAGTETTTGAATSTDITILEPAITTVTKLADNTTPLPGETITYTVELTAASGANVSDVFDVTLVDVLQPGLTYAGSPTVSLGSGVGADNIIGAPVISIDGGTGEETLLWSIDNVDPTDIDIAAGETITVTYQVTVDSDQLAGVTLSNSISSQWTSIDDVNGGERTGDDGVGGALNDYATTAVAETVTTPDIIATITKVRSDDTWGSGDVAVRVGDIVDYTLTISMPEGTLGNASIVDTLPQGLDFVEVVSINGDTSGAPYAAVAPFVHADIAAPVEAGDPATGPSTVTWTIGDLHNPPNDGVADNFVIIYRAQVLNGDVLAATPLSQDLNNTVDLTYDRATTPYTSSDIDTIVTVQQPSLSVTKTAAPAGGDLAVVAGEVVTYTVDIINAGDAPAYDAVLQDTLPAGMRTAGISTTSITLIDTSTSALLSTLTAFDPAYTAATGVAIWDFDSGVADAYTIPAGQSLRIVYTATVDAAVGQGLTLPNAAQTTIYYSFDDEAVPAVGAATGAREDYGPTNTASAPVYTAAGPSKVLVSPAPAIPEATIGQVITYQITVPGSTIGSPLYDLTVTDTLNTNLELVSVNISGGAVGVTDNSTSTAMSLSIDEIPAGQQAIIDLQVRVLNSSGANAGTALGNTASYTYAFTDAGTQQAALADSATDVTVTEPILGLSKGFANATSPGQPPDAGDRLVYTLTLPASGAGTGDNFSDAFDVSITDSLSLGLSYIPGTATVDGAGNTISDPSITGDGDSVAQVLTWSLADATADIDVPENTTVTITYEVLVRDSVVPGQVLSNSATAQWTSLDGDVTGERTGSGTPAENDYTTTAPPTTTTVPDNTAIAKSRINDTWGGADADVRIGDIIEYEIRVTLNEGDYSSITINDTLPVGLRFEGTTSINGDTATPFAASSPFSHDDVAGAVVTGDGVSASTSLTWNINNLINVADNNAANDEFVIVYRARVLNDVLAQAASTTLSNTATLLYSDASGAVLPQPSSTANVTVQQPILGITKSVTTPGGDTVIDASEVVTYTVEIANTGTAPAYDLVIQDTLPDGMRDTGVVSTTISLLSGAALPSLAPTSYDAVTGIATWDFDAGGADTYTIPAGDTLIISYDVQADADLGPGLTLTNSALGQTYYSFDNEAAPTLGTITGVRQAYNTPFGPATTTLTSSTPGALLKDNPLATSVTIGEEFTYTITVPETPVNVALYDVRILDDLTALGADVTVVSIADATGTATWNPINVSGSNNLIIIDGVNGIDIPAGEQAILEITLRVNNVAGNVSGDTLINTATYTYNRIDGNSGTQTAGTGDTTTAITLAEPDLTLSKSATPLSPIDGGTVMTFTLTMVNNGTSTAFDVDVTDTLPPELSFDGSVAPTATIDGAPVVGFVATPAGAPGGPLVWGNSNGDGSLDVPPTSTLVITYQAVVNSATQPGATFSNTVYSHYSSLDGASAFERDGAGCPTVAAPDDYCAGPAQVNLTVNDTNTIAKSIIADSYATSTDGVVRVGDTITYRLELILQEGLTNNIVVTDALPAGLAFLDMVSINGDAAADYTPPASGAGSNFSYNPISAASLPTAGDTGSLVFSLGNIANDPLGDATTDTLVIEYRAEVLTNTIAQAPTTTLTNTATLVYDDATGTPITPDPVQHQASANATVLQPVLTTITKIDPARTSPYTATVATDVMNFQIESCNATGLAPAYGVIISDTLATQLDETSISNLVVWINGAVAPAVDYVYTAPTVRGGSFTVELLQPIQPGQCAQVDYDIAFYSDFGPNQTWNNSAQVDEYWSLGAGSGQQYAAVGPAQFVMNNNTTIDPPTKTTTVPASGEATIGETVTYQIVVPTTPANAALFDVTVTDTLNAALSVTSIADVSGNGLAITDNSTGNNLSLVIDQIPAGQQAIIEIQTVVANNGSANGGDSFTNTASYTYATTSGGGAVAGGNSTTATPVNIVEPLLTLSKAVTNVSNAGQPPGAGDILRYTLTLPASGGVAADAYSDAFDVGITDNLSLGLEYQTGTSTVDGGNSITDPNISGDGSSVAQTLTWSLADGSADIDVAEGGTVTITYDVLVLDSVLAGQTLSNSAVATWTGLDGINALERDGSGSPAENDYVTVPAVTSQVVQDNTAFAKSRINDTWNAADDNVRIGDIIEYELRVTLNEGANQNVVISDTLPLGLRFEGVASINGDTVAPYDPVAPFTHISLGAPTVSGDGVGSPTNLIWNIGNITNAANNNAADDDFVIIYRARVLDGFFAQSATTTLTNNASVFYTNNTGPVTLTDSYVVTLDQPILAVTKAAAPAGGDTVIDASENVVYTVEVSNSGNAPAYDVTVTDIIPAGMRNTGGPGSITISLVTGGALAPLAPTYDALTGTATWVFDDAAYAIPAGDTLRIVYTVQADADLGAGLTLTNTVEAPVYYSFDDATAPNIGTITGTAEVYGPTNQAQQTLTTGAPVALDKQNTATDAVVGIPFNYTIIVPATPQSTALNDVRIIDDLGASTASLSFVSVQKISAGGSWVPVNTGTATSLVIEDIANGGIDIPAGTQIELEVTVVLNDDATNVSGLVFTNTADYTYNAINDDAATQQAGLPDTTGAMTIIGPDTLAMAKSGPATMRTTAPGDFRLSLQNTGTATAWDVTITDLVPHPDPGGMCDAAPFNIVVQMYDSTGTVTTGPVLTENTDYTVSFVPGTPNCTLTFTMTSAAAAIAPTEILVIDYSLNLDVDTPHSTTLINIAGATEWFSADTAGAGATGEIRTYTRTLSDGTNGIPTDHEAAHTVLSESPVILFSKSVENLTTGTGPVLGITGSPGDRLRYTLTITNTSSAVVTDFSISDELDALNTDPAFAAGTLTVTDAAGGVDTSDANGGTAGTGQLSINSLALGAAGSATETVTITFEVNLAAVITSGTVVQNQAGLTIGTFPPAPSNDPVINTTDQPDIIGDEVATEILITAAPAFEIFKTSTDISTGNTGLLAGDFLRYTITVRNTGSEDAINAVLQDSIPVNTTYRSGSTTLNGATVTDPTLGVSALEAGMAINSSDTAVAGYMTADPDGSIGAVATITFEVTINNDVLNGAVISNQAGLTVDGLGSGTAPSEVSDDPATATLDDPTRDIVGNLPLLDSTKTVSLITDVTGNGFVDPGDTLQYTITVTNYGAIPATGVSLTDAVPANTTYVTNSTFLNGQPVGQPDGGASPLDTAAGIVVSSADVPGTGTVSSGATATVTFNVVVTGGTVISNQGYVSSSELPVEPTDADGDDSNGDQPTLIGVGNTQQLSISKTLQVVGGGAATAGGQLEYIVQITNVALVPATGVVITDDLSGGQMSYVANSGTLNGLTAGVTYDAPSTTLTADYSGTYGDLAPGASATLRFRVDLAGGLPLGTTVTNTAVATWNTTQTASAQVSIDIGGVPGAASINGNVWHDGNFDGLYTGGEPQLANWSVNVYRNGSLVGSFLTNATGSYRVTGLAPNDVSGDIYEIRFSAPGAGPNTASLGSGDSGGLFNDGLQSIGNLVLSSGSNVQNLNLPIEPNGVVYNSITRAPVVGATLTMVDYATGAAVDSSCFDDPAQQGQVTLASGYYKFDMNFNHASCPRDGDFMIQVAVPADGYTAGISQVIAPPAADALAPYSVPTCTGDAVAGSRCEAVTTIVQPGLAVPANSAGTVYHLRITLTEPTAPDDSQIFNNHIPLDPDLDQLFTVSKTSAKLNVSRGDIVPYTITVRNSLPLDIFSLNIIDDFPAGFKYVEDSARFNDVASEPGVIGNTLTWTVPSIGPNEEIEIKLLLIVGSGVQDGEYVNRARVFSTLTNTGTGDAQATVRVIPDPTFDCTDVIGKVFDDRNLNGIQDGREAGIPGVRLATARGLLATTDEYGRFHVTCAATPDERRGSNFILKLDEATLPSGFRVTSENPRVERATRGKALNFSFGATIHHVVNLDVADGAFEKDGSALRPQWAPRLGLLIEQLRKGPSVLRLTYLADVEDEGLVEDRVDDLRDLIMDHWESIDSYKLTIETEIFWRHGGPVD